MAMARVRFLLPLALVLVVSGCSQQDPGSGTANGWASASHATAGPDFDGDGLADLVVGIGSDPAQITVRYGTGATAALRRSDLDGTDPSAVDGTDSTAFGSALLARDLDADGYTDLVIGHPSTSVPAAVFLVPGSSDGLRPADATVLSAPSGVARFGASLALVTSPRPILAVGASAGTSSAPGGAVVTWRLDQAGHPDGRPTVITQDSDGMPGGGRAGDAFGSVLAATGSWLAVAAPRRDSEGIRDSGAVYVIGFGSDAGSPWVLTQGEGGVPGTAAAEDRFGLALAARDYLLVVGAPLDDEPGRDAGTVQTFRLTSNGPVVLDQLTRATTGSDPVPGDLFGFSVAVAHGCADVPGVLVGAPAVTTAGASQAGAAWLVSLDDQCATQELVEGGVLGGSATSMARIGNEVSAIAGESGQVDSLVLAAPGNNEEGLAGRVLIATPPYDEAAVTGLAGIVVAEEGAVTLGPPAG